MSRPTASIDELMARAREGHRGALARLLTRVERGGADADRVSELCHGPVAAHVVGVTGAPGAGKSSLTGHLLACLARDGRTPAVLAVDPSSPLTGGAILGDRVRMDGLAGDAFVRSMATRGHRGGLALAVPAALRLLAVAGFDPLIVETTGVGQVELDIAGAADTTVLVVAAGWGDAVQANKAGLLEVADVLVVNKADRPGARDARRDLELMLDLGRLSGLEERRGARPPILLTTSTTGDGVEEVRRAVDAHRDHLAASGAMQERRRRRARLELGGRVDRLLLDHTDEVLASAAGRRIAADLDAGRRSPSDAARAVLEELAGRL